MSANDNVPPKVWTHVKPNGGRLNAAPGILASGLLATRHCICSAQQALSIRHVGPINPSNKPSTTIRLSARRWIRQPVALVPGWVDLKKGEHGVLLLELVALSRLKVRSLAQIGSPETNSITRA